MATGDVKIREKGSGRVEVFRTEAAATAINPGEPVKVGGTGSNYVVPLATGDPEIGTDIFVGIAQKASTQTASADGTVEVFVPAVDTVLECAAETAGNVDTDAKLLAIENDCVTFDLASSTYTIDENEGDDDNVHGLRILGGDIDKGRLYVAVKNEVTLTGSNIA